LIDIIIPCDREFCVKAGLTGAGYDIYSADSLYLQIAIDVRSSLISLDEEFLDKVNLKPSIIEAYHIKEAPYQFY
jgi:predicted nucleic acid-binding protein